jgi:lipoate-protein ligase A
MKLQRRATRTCDGRPRRATSLLNASWRLIVHGAVDGALNMAIDRAIQMCRAQDLCPPTVRLYRWARPTVTHGKFQSLEGIDRAVCGSLGVDVVRRFTGGRGVLHDDEVTYSVVASTRDGIPRGTTDSYAYLSSALVRTYQSLGIEAELTKHRRGDAASSACYLQSTLADLSSGTSKLSGSAQVWLGSTVLQHGSFTRSRDWERERDVFRLTREQLETLRRCTVAIDEVCAQHVDDGSLVAACISGFQTGLGIKLVEGELSALEALYAAQLVAEPLVHAHPRPVARG